MNRRDFLKLSAGAGAMTLVPGCLLATPQPQKKKPNFVFILIDDMGWTDAGCYGSTFYETPNIDKLAAEGMRFTNAYAACPVCSPTRASILTGKYPARINLTDWIGPD
ncbi:MAG: sulfatase-like hydrolase/transferase, partial [Planctomycetota bacterium]